MLAGGERRGAAVQWCLVKPRVVPFYSLYPPTRSTHPAHTAPPPRDHRSHIYITDYMSHMTCCRLHRMVLSVPPPPQGIGHYSTDIMCSDTLGLLNHLGWEQVRMSRRHEAEHSTAQHSTAQHSR